MTHPIEVRLAELGVTLPEAPAPVAAYVPFRTGGGETYISGQLPIADGKMTVGQLGSDMTALDGAVAARQCAINLLAQIKAACGGDFGRFGQLIKLTGFVNSAPDFRDHPAVVNGASEFLGEALGEAGRHARSAVGVSSLPLGAAVEIEAIVEIS